MNRRGAFASYPAQLALRGRHCAETTHALRHAARALLAARARAFHALRVDLERAQRRDLNAAGRPVYELPALSDGIDLGGLYRLAEELRDQGAGK